MSQSKINILFIGDIVARFGRQVVAQVLPELRREFQQIDAIITNGENSAGGYGITESVYKELSDMGLQAFTMGNHIWDKKEFIKNINIFENVVRPANYPSDVPGKESLVLEANGAKIAIINLLGRVFMHSCYDCPFKAADRLIEKLKKETNAIIVDMHAEATSEKQSIAWYLDGRVSAVLGTHTHVQTADERILPKGTAYIADVGMVGALNSIIGMEKDQIIHRFLTQMPHKFEPTAENPGIFNAVMVSIDKQTGKAVSIKRINKIVNKVETKTTTAE